MKEIKIINLDGVSLDEAESYDLRYASRAVVFDNDNLVALLHVSRDNYYKLPGGGIENGEDKEEALKRECLEEIGCNVEVINEVGSIIEYRKESRLKQISYCYLVKVYGDKLKPNFTDLEIEKGFEVKWVSYDNAIEFMEANIGFNNSGGYYIVPRDKIFLQEVKNYLNPIIKL